MVQLRDAAGNPVPNAQITFRCNVPRAMACQFTPGGEDNGTLHVNTGSDGVAVLNGIGGESMT